MSRVEQKHEAHLSFHTINSPECIKALQVFSDLFKVCAGPHGKNHVVRNSNRGHVTVTSACARLLSSMSITRPELKLISAAVDSHVQQCADGGLFMTHLCSKLILLSSDLGLHHHKSKCLYEMFMDIIISHLAESDCKVIVEAGFDHLNVLLAYVSSIFSSKSLLNLTSNECDIISRLVVQVFLESVPQKKDFRCSWDSDLIYLLTLENLSYSQSCYHSGVLLEWPEQSIIRGSQVINVKMVKVTEELANTLSLPLDSPIIKVALITCSMSGDLDEMVEAHFEVTRAEEEELEMSVLEKMLQLCQALDDHNVGVVLCQKVIHPKIKAALRSKQICFVDRLGSQVIPYLQDLTDAKPLSTVVEWPDLDSCLGWVTCVKHLVKFDRSYLFLSSKDAPVVTLMLCGSWEQKLEEFKTCVKTALKGLSALLREKKLLMGGGCWQVYISQVLKSKVKDQLKCFAEKISCTEAQVLKALTVFQASLHSWALALADETESLVVDPISHHVWRVAKGKQDTLRTDKIISCCCGLKAARNQAVSDFHYLSIEESVSMLLVDSENNDTGTPNVVEDQELSSHTVLDNYFAVTRALKQAVTTANLIMSIGQFIIDRN